MDNLENHPIPQDVTGFKFRIIGSITIRQFLYLLGSGTAATILIFLIPMHLLFKIPLVILFGGIGPFFAFIPVEGRAADLMLANFFRAVFTNSLYVYQKQGANLALFPMFNFQVAPSGPTKQQTSRSDSDKKRAMLAKALRTSTYQTDPRETERINRVNSFFNEEASATTPSASTQIVRPPADTNGAQQPSQTPSSKPRLVADSPPSNTDNAVPTDNTEKSVPKQNPQPQSTVVQKESAQQSSQTPQSPSSVAAAASAQASVQTQVSNKNDSQQPSSASQSSNSIPNTPQQSPSSPPTQPSASQKQKSASQPKNTGDTPPQQNSSTTSQAAASQIQQPASTQPKQNRENASVQKQGVSPQQTTNTTPQAPNTQQESGQQNTKTTSPVHGFETLPDKPNIVLGVVTDARGKTLPNILVEVLDSEETPVRTLKTNARGQFAAATPLPNGSYQVKFEDARGVHQFATMSIELVGQIFEPIHAKSVDSREKLRKDLFGDS